MMNDGPRITHHASRITRHLPLALTLLAFLLRAYKLDAQSYWIDEGWTLFFANISLADLWQWLTTEELHPPLYFPLLNGWVKLLGDSEFSTRFVSLWFSVLAVPLTYRLGRALGDARLGVIAALLLAVAPYQIWHAQDARNYAMLTAAAALSMWAFVRLWQGSFGDWRWWLLYLLGTAWLPMAHYHGLAIIGVQGLFVLLTLPQRGLKRALVWLGGLALALLPLAAWLAVGPNLLKSAHWLTPVSLPVSYARGAAAYSIGELVPPPLNVYLTLPFVALVGLGLIYAARRRWNRWQGREMLIFLLAFTLAPNVAAWLFGLLRTPVYLERYLIPVQIGFLLTVAAGLLAIYDLRITRYASHLTPHASQITGVLLLALLLGISGWVLWQHYSNPLYAKPNWRGVAQTIEQFGLPGDALLLTGDGGEKVMAHYYHGPLPVYFDFNTPVPSPDEAARILADITASNRRLWFTPYGAPIDPSIESSLRENTFPAWQQWLGRKRLALYQTQAELAPPQLLNTRFAAGPELVSIAKPAGPTAAGDTLPLELTWRTESPLPGNLQLSLRLLNPQGDVFAQSDWPPLPPAAQWTPGQPVTDRRALWLPADVPPGDYLLQFVVYNPADGQPLGQPVTLPGITVTAAQITPPPEALAIPNFTIHNSEFTIHNSQLVGFTHPETLRPGQPLWLWLYWQATGPVPPDAALRVSLTGGDESVSAEWPLAEVFGALEGWQPGQVRRGVIHLPTSPRLRGESARLAVSLLEPDSPPAEFPLGDIALQTRERTFDAPALQTPLDVIYGEPPKITLLGANQKSGAGGQASGKLDLTLVWRAETEMEINYTVFVQLLNPAGQVAAQVDAQPRGGAAPTTTWLPGEIISDDISLTLPPDLPPGQYRLIAGLYDAASGARLPVSGGGDFVELQQVTLE